MKNRTSVFIKHGREMYHPHRVCRIKAFTLIELLVVISIIALLISILLPTLGSAREAGRASVCSSNQRQLGIAQIAYANDFGGDHNHAWEGTDFTVRPYTWGAKLIRGTYINGPEVLVCPNDDLARPGFVVAPDHVNVSYALNGIVLSGNPRSVIGGPSTPSTLDALSRTFSTFTYEVRPFEMSSTIMMGEAFQGFNALNPDGSPAGNATNWFNGARITGFMAQLGFSSATKPYSPDAHGTSANYVFFDGHVERRQLSDDMIRPESVPGAQDFGFYWGGI